MAGKIIVFSGPSGVGKSTIAKKIAKEPELNLTFSVSACSRAKRENEIEGVDYHFLSIDEFKDMIEEDEFLEWEEVYPGHYYGTIKSHVDEILNQGKNVVMDIDVMGGINIKRIYKQQAKIIFIKPLSVNVLEERLVKRNTEAPNNLKKRLRKAKMELTYANKFDHAIVNDNLDTAISEVKDIVKTHLES